MLKKIAIMGAQNSGKTTSLYYALYMMKKTGKTLGIGHEVARNCPYPLADGAGFLTQLWILNRQIEMETRLQNYYKNVLLDRCVYDSIAYSLTLWKLEKLIGKQFSFIADTARKWAKTMPYSTLIYLNPMTLEKDPQRGSNSKSFQSRIAESFKYVIENEIPKKTEILTIDYNPKEERCIEVYRLIRDRLK